MNLQVADIHFVQHDVDKEIKYVSLLSADFNKDVYSSMRETTLIQNPLVTSKSLLPLAK
jgi:hypothetical protein